MTEEQYLSIFLRTRINEGGLHYKPGPIIEARRCSDLNLLFRVNDLANDKAPVDLDLTNIRFIVRKNRYPKSVNDIIIDLTTHRGVYHPYNTRGVIRVELSSENLNIQTTDYWYDILINWSTESELLQAQYNEELIRPPLGLFRVVK